MLAREAATGVLRCTTGASQLLLIQLLVAEMAGEAALVFRKHWQRVVDALHWLVCLRAVMTKVSRAYN